MIGLQARARDPRGPPERVVRGAPEAAAGLV